MRQGAQGWCTGMPCGIGWGGRWEGGSGWGIHVHLWQIHVNVWQYQLKKEKEYTEELDKKDLQDPDNHDGVITHLG